MTENELTNLKPIRISMTPIQFERFEEMLNAEPKDMPKLRALLNRPVIWAEEPCS
jgi:uncharacterized protein (DUF1778 family)